MLLTGLSGCGPAADRLRLTTHRTLSRARAWAGRPCPSRVRHQATTQSPRRRAPCLGPRACRARRGALGGPSGRARVDGQRTAHGAPRTRTDLQGHDGLMVYLEQVVRNVSRDYTYTLGSDVRQQSREFGVCPTLLFVTRRRRCGQMRGRRREADSRFTPHGSTLRRAQGPELSRGTSSPSRAKSRDVSRFLGAGRARRRWSRIVRRSRTVNVGQAPKAEI